MLLERKTIVSRAALVAVALVLAACSDNPLPPAGPPLTHQTTDDFAGTTLDGNKWQYYRGNSAQVSQNDRLMVAVIPNAAEAFSGIMYQLPHRFVNSYFFAEVGQVAAGLGTTETYVAVTTADSEEFVIMPSLGGLIGAWYRWGTRPCNVAAHAVTIRGTTYCQIGNIPFDPTGHRFRRVREAGGIVHFEVSANGTNWASPPGWTIEHRFTDTDQLHGLVGVGAFNPDPTQGVAIFENVNTNLPAIPSQLVATRTSGTEVTLTWQIRSVNESGFRIERRTPGGTFAEIGTVNANVNTFQNTGLTAGTSYEYRVRAFNATGNSGFTNTAPAAAQP